MKKLLTFLAATAMVAVSVSSCQRETPDVKEASSVHFVIRAGAPETKTYIENNFDGSYSAGWNADDKLAVFFSGITSNLNDKAEYIFENTAGKGEEATFEGNATIDEGEGNFLSFYPASALAKTYDGTIGVDLKELQNPSCDSFDPSCDILVAQPCNYFSDGEEVLIEDLYFKRILSVLKVNLNTSFDDINGETVKSFKIDAPEGIVLTGRPAINLATAQITKWNKSFPYVSATLTDVEIGTELVNSVYLVVNPTTIPSGNDVIFTIETDNYDITKTVTLSKDMSFPQGNIAVINLTILEPECLPKAAPKTIPYEEDFTKSAGSFTIDNVNLGDIDYVWALDNTYGFKASAFVNKAAHETESWIVSPTIDLSNASGAVLTFDQALNNLKTGDREDCVDVLIKVDDQDWETLSIDSFPAGSDWNFITSSANLYLYLGSKIKIGFKYTSDSDIAPTWEIKNFSVKEPETTLAFDITEKQIFVGGSFENVANTNSPATVTYTSSNSSIATVTGTGTITGVSTGTCTITASVESYQGYPAKEATCSIEVLEDTSEKWIETPLSDITSNAVFVIVGDNGSTYAMSNNNGTSAPSATAVTISDGKISSVVANIIKWNLTKSGNQYIFYPNGDHNTWLYCTDANNGLKVGDGEGTAFVVDEESGYLVNVTRNRYVGIYNNQDWRSYTSINNNIKDQSFSFYVLDGTNTEPTTVAVTGVELDESSLDLTVGDEETLVATVKPSNATNKGVNWSSSDDDVATVSNGVVTAVGVGEAIITVTTVDGEFTATCNVTVTNPVTPPSGETVTYTLTILPTDLSGSSYSANDGEKIFTAVAAGGATTSVTLNLKSTMLQSKKIQMKKNEGKITNVTDLGSISSINITNASNITSTFTTGSGNFSIDAGAAVGTCDEIEIVFTK